MHIYIYVYFHISIYIVYSRQHLWMHPYINICISHMSIYIVYSKQPLCIHPYIQICIFHISIYIVYSKQPLSIHPHIHICVFHISIYEVYSRQPLCIHPYIHIFIFHISVYVHILFLHINISYIHILNIHISYRYIHTCIHPPCTVRCTCRLKEASFTRDMTHDMAWLISWHDLTWIVPWQDSLHRAHISHHICDINVNIQNTNIWNITNRTRYIRPTYRITYVMYMYMCIERNLIHTWCDSWL